MTFEIFLLTGVLLGGLSLISFLSALIDGRRPWVAALVLVIAAGLIFLAASFVSIGLFASSITDNQIISFILGIVLSGFIYIGFETIYSLDLFGSFDLLVKTLGIEAHYSAISRGVVDTRDLIYFLSLIALFILLTKTSIESRKW